MAKILVVDDEPDLELLLRQKFRRRIRTGEFSLVFAQNGVEALEQLERHPDVDMVLSDINMPEMDGLTLLGQLDKLNLDIRAVIVTAYGDMKNIRTAMNRGAFDFVTKPIDFEDLDTTIQKTLDHLQVMRDALRSRDELVALRQELGVAARMQESILPTHYPEDSRFEMHAWMTPAREVGGDFYDFFQLEDDRIGIVMADVSGKGIPAAFFMMVSRTLLKGTAIGESDPAKCLGEVNDLLVKENEESMFVTAFYAKFQPLTGRVDFSNAGHNLPFIVKPSGEVEQIECEPGLVLGIMPTFDYPSGSVQMEPGDTFFFYTDGISEAMDEEGNEFGEKQLAEVLAECGGLTASDVNRHVVQTTQDHAGEAPQSDDITCLALRYLGDTS
ncbi:PP2C family protein-serine/threonine phosphatase [Candidatus Palauibacter sp.]|uniref:PP2C family protein-serine/threonine phosphatase n=1 Tax=Candidatus Palauibacter sp. TaxID=3101350 RepID=UPI003C6F9D92